MDSISQYSSSCCYSSVITIYTFSIFNGYQIIEEYEYDISYIDFDNRKLYIDVYPNDYRSLYIIYFRENYLYCTVLYYADYIEIDKDFKRIYELYFLIFIITDDISRLKKPKNEALRSLYTYCKHNMKSSYEYSNIKKFKNFKYNLIILVYYPKLELRNENIINIIMNLSVENMYSLDECCFIDFWNLKYLLAGLVEYTVMELEVCYCLFHSY